jgi:hypothetical protein
MELWLLENQSRSLNVVNSAAEQIVGRERREREIIADFQLPIVDLIRVAASTLPFDLRLQNLK